MVLPLNYHSRGELIHYRDYLWPTRAIELDSIYLVFQCCGFHFLYSPTGAVELLEYSVV